MLFDSSAAGMYGLKLAPCKGISMFTRKVGQAFTIHRKHLARRFLITLEFDFPCQ
jgi:hypothetical protein